MEPPSIPVDEVQRLAALHRYDVLDSAPEQSFDRITRLAARMLDAPVALVSLVDGDRQWFKSRVGLEASETPRDISFCGHAINADEVLVVPDATIDLRFADNPLVTGPPNVRFYAGAPLRTKDGFLIGTLCIIDHHARHGLTPEERSLLVDLAAIVVDQLELRFAARRILEQHGDLQAARDQALEATAAKSRFLAHASHEMRTPLAAIVGFAELLELEPLSPQARQNVSLIANAGRDLGDLIDDLLEVTAHGTSVHNDQIDLGTTLADNGHPPWR